MKINKKLRNLAIGGLIGLASLMPFKSYSSEPVPNLKITGGITGGLSKNYNNNLNPSLELNQKKEVNPNLLIRMSKDASLGLLADAIRVVVHEQGHYDKAVYDLGVNASVDYGWGLNHNGLTQYYGNLNNADAAKFDMAGLVKTGELAEKLRQDISFGYSSGDDLKFKSMLALSAEMNLPFYIWSDLWNDINNKIDLYNDITNYCENAGVKQEQLALASGIHILLNSPYLYRLVKNVVSENPGNLEKKDYYFSFRFDGDRYVLSFNANPNFLEEKISDLGLKTTR